jgi:PAS domain S-box-containing protein
MSEVGGEMPEGQHDMNAGEDGRGPNQIELGKLAVKVTNHVDAMLAYWDRNLVCRFANSAYVQWFGRTPEEMIDRIRMPELLGPLYELNLPFIQGALAGRRQTFERRIPTPSGEVRYSLANYYPDVEEEKVKGFFVHVADITILKVLELEKQKTQLELSAAKKEITTLAGLLPICAWCKKVRDDQGYWQQIEKFISERSELSFTHSICNDCLASLSGSGARASGEQAA